MKIKINGNVITVISELPFDILETVGKTTVKDENGKILYACATGPRSSISEVGTVFNFKTNEGKAALNLVSDCFDQAALAEDFVKTHQGALENLMKFENALVETIRDRYNARNALVGMIEVE